MSQTPTKDQAPTTAFDALMADCHTWTCPECGEKPTTLTGRWRWTGERWQHHHGYPAGHLDAVQVPAPPVDATGVK